MNSLFKSRSTYRRTDLMHDLTAEMDHGLFQNLCRINSTDFEWLLNQIGSQITKQDTAFRDSIPPSERLILTQNIKTAHFKNGT
nr:unnamed protein product [Callosobruchus chinensis]